VKPRQSTVEQLLDGGDRRSIGGVRRLVARVRRNPALLPDVVAALSSPRPLVAMRAADALEKISHYAADRLEPYRRRLLRVTIQSADPIVRWNLIQLLPRLACGRLATRRLARRLELWYLMDASAIVRASALEAIVTLGERDEGVQALAHRMLGVAMSSPSAAVRARARRLTAARVRGKG
jgi:HEAT repeat protein